jgi:hypothetical protein
MVAATNSSRPHDDPGSDPTLSSLVPQRSLARDAALLALALLGLIGLWGSHGLVRPTVVSDSGGGSWSPVPTHAQVATVVLLDPSGWSRNLQSVTDVPGAQVAGAWLFATDETDFDDTLDPADYAGGVAYLEAAFPTRDFDERSQLPQRVPRNGPSQLLVLWNITDCAALTAGPAPQAEIRTWLATTTRQHFDDFYRPGHDMAILAEAGICP